MKAILEDIRVLDLGRFIAAPLCGSLLAELGANVIRIEPPAGAEDRYMMSIVEGGEGATYLQCNKGKRSLALDTSAAEGQATLYKLVEQADVVLLSTPAKVLQRLGLDYDTLRAINPAIISVQVSAFASHGPDRNRGGFDGVGQSMSGAMALTGFGETPCRAAVSYVDYSTGIACAYGTLAAIINKLKTGEGTLVESNLLTTAMTMTAPMLIEETTGTRSRVATGNRSPIAGPSDLFATQDGWVMIQVIGNGMFKRWANLMQKPELLENPRFASDQLRGDNGAELSSIMAKWCAAKTTSECLQRLEEARLPAGTLLTPQDVIQPESGLLPTYCSPMDFPGLGMTVPVPNTLAALNTKDVDETPRAPMLGEHTLDVLEEFQLPAEDIESLLATGLALNNSSREPLNK